MRPVFECGCEKCRSACTHKPGMFMPGEAESLAAKMGVHFEELFRTRLEIEKVPCQPFDILVLSPGVDESGACVFFEQGRCAIHALEKPYECARATHWDGASLAEIVNAWVPYQDDLRDRVAAGRSGVGPGAA